MSSHEQLPHAHKHPSLSSTTESTLDASCGPLQRLANDSPHVQQLKSIQAAANSSFQVSQLKTAQHAANQYTTQLKQEEQSSGLPATLRSGIEQLSGTSMEGVHIHRNSSKPSQVGALAYAQGNDIHLGPGQEQHLPHEAWHIAQQRQGRVSANTEVNGMGVNNDHALEAEADHMGTKAMQLKAHGNLPSLQPSTHAGDSPIQAVFGLDDAIFAVTVLGAAAVLAIISCCMGRGMNRQQAIEEANAQAQALQRGPAGGGGGASSVSASSSGMRLSASPAEGSELRSRFAAPASSSAAAAAGAGAASASSVEADERKEPEVDAQPDRHTVTPLEAQQMREFMRPLAATPGMGAMDLEMLIFMRRVLEEDTCTPKEWRIISRYMTHSARQAAAPAAAAAAAAPTIPAGYALRSAFGQNVLIRNVGRLDAAHAGIAIQHLIGDNIHRSRLMRGAAPGAPYLHTSKTDGTSIYLITIDGPSGDGIPMYTIVRQGRVTDGVHDFS